MKPSLAENDMKKNLIYRLPLMSSMSMFLRQNEPIILQEMSNLLFTWATDQA